MTPPTAPPADTSPQTMPVDRRDTNGTTPYTEPQVPYTNYGYKCQAHEQGFTPLRHPPHAASGGQRQCRMRLAHALITDL